MAIGEPEWWLQQLEKGMISKQSFSAKMSIDVDNEIEQLRKEVEQLKGEIHKKTSLEYQEDVSGLLL